MLSCCHARAAVALLDNSCELQVSRVVLLATWSLVFLAEARAAPETLFRCRRRACWARRRSRLDGLGRTRCWQRGERCRQQTRRRQWKEGAFPSRTKLSHSQHHSQPLARGRCFCTSHNHSQPLARTRCSCTSQHHSQPLARAHHRTTSPLPHFLVL